MGDSFLSKLPSVLVLGVGVVLVAVTLVASQLSASRAADEVVAGAAPLVTERGVVAMRADLEKAEAVASALEGDGLTRLAELAGETRAGLLAELEAGAPAARPGRAEIVEIGALADKVITNLERRLDQFDSAESLPGVGASLHDAAWARLVLGVLLVIVGIAGLIRPMRLLAGLALVIGALMVAGPLALGHPGKTADTDELLDSLRPFSLEKVEAREQALATARHLFDGFREHAIPAVAERARLSRAAVARELGEVSPQLSPASLDETDAILDRFAALVEFSRRIQPELVEADELSARENMWLGIGPGAVLVLAGALGLFWKRSPRPAQDASRAAR